MLLVEFFLKNMQHFLEDLHISHTELGHVLLEMRLIMIYLVLALDDFLSQGQFIGNGFVKRDAYIHGQL